MKLTPAGWILPLLLSAASLSSAAEHHVLPGHIPAAATRLRPSGRLDGAQLLNLSIGLPLRNRAALTNLLHDLYDSASPNYRHYLTPAQFAEQFGPTLQDYAALVAFAYSNGLAITAEHSNRVLLDVQGPASAIEKAFHVQLLLYPHPAEPRSFYAPNVEPSLPTPLRVLHISGLENFALPHPASLRTGHTPIPQVGTGPGGSYLGNDFRKAYAPGVSLTGAGQSVGLLEFDGYYTNDVAAYKQLAGLPDVPVTTVLLDSFNGTPGANNVEVALDIEMAMAMAPGLAQVILYDAGPFGLANDMLNRMATDNSATQLASSWSWGAGDEVIADQIFLQFAAQGQSFFNSSGDSGAYSGSVPFPKGNPYITIVGGTVLSTAPDGTWTGETAWSKSGGGICSNYSIPTWQQALDMSTNAGSAVNRNIPDVSLVASGILAIYNNGLTNPVDGTSASAPLWAAFTALANQQGAAYGQPPAGFLNPLLYTLGQQSNYATGFHDIAAGNNTTASSPTHFFAVTGFDLCTGWGSPRGQPLIDALQPPDPLVAIPQTGFDSTGPVGGPFTVAAETFMLTNTGTVPLAWSLSHSTTWLEAAPASGTLAPGDPATQVTVRLASSACSLPAGNYTADVWLTNQSAGLALNRRFTLAIGQSLVQNGGFEGRNYLGWTLTDTPGNDVVSQGTGAIAPHSGGYVLVLGQYNSLGYLSQSFTTTPGQPYLLSFWLENPQAGTPNQFLVNWLSSGGTTNTLLNRLNLGAFNWTNFQFLINAPSTNSTLQFGFRNDPQYFGLDDIKLVPVPLPALESTAQRAGSTLSLSWRALAGLKYQVQYTTNLLHPAWMNLGSLLLATNDTMSASDTLAGDPQRFYRVVGSP